MTRFLGAFLHLVDDLHHFGFGDRRRAVFCAANETRHLVGVLHQVPSVVVHDHFNQHIAREELALGGFLLAILDLDHLFHGHENPAKLGLHARAGDALGDVALNGFFHA